MALYPSQVRGYGLMMSVTLIILIAHKPRTFPFSKRKFGKETVVKRSFQGSWFTKWPWLHYAPTLALGIVPSCFQQLIKEWEGHRPRVVKQPYCGKCFCKVVILQLSGSDLIAFQLSMTCGLNHDYSIA